jgi:ketosteroid isomerase-like protein
MSPTGIFQQFVNAINSHDVKSLTALMTADHVFVDSLGNRAQSATSMEAGWRGYFGMCPDYWIRTEDVIPEGATVLAAGKQVGL